MSTPREPSQHAIKLFAFLQDEWDKLGTTPTAWARANGIPDPTVLRWRQGIEPDVRSLRRVAEALGRSFLDVLVAAGYITKDEANGHVPVPRVVDARLAIREDPSLTAVARESLLQLLDAIQMVESGAASSVRVKGTQRQRRRA